jgi:hypothetical protein
MSAHPQAIPARFRSTVARFAAACETDPRVLAGLVGGSVARGDADDYSDLDLGVVVADEHHASFWSERAAFIGLLGDPLFIEDFSGESPVHVILADGTEAELGVGRASRFADINAGPFIAVVDKAGVLDGVTFLDYVEPDADQRELLRHQVDWFWHDLSHLIAAVGRRHRWWALGQLETLREMCVTLARLDADFTIEAEGYDKVDRYLPPERLEPLTATVGLLAPADMVEAAQRLMGIHAELARSLAARHGLAYPSELEDMFTRRLAELHASLVREGVTSW